MRKAESWPQTDSIQELASFWDTHALTDFESELEEVGEPVFKREANLSLYLNNKEAEVVRKLAKLKGLAENELIREWILEKTQAKSAPS